MVEIFGVVVPIAVLIFVARLVAMWLSSQQQSEEKNVMDLKWLDMLPMLKSVKDPGWAAVIGLLTGGIGLSIYLNALVPIVLGIAVYIAFDHAAAFGPLLGALVSGVYGYARVQNSNTRRAATVQP
jgi:hypothetical protein